MTLEDLLGELHGTRGDAALIFEAAQGAIGPGYHVTEFRQADVTGIDCGGKVSMWREAVMQLMEGHGRSHMAVGKFRAIAEASLAQVDGLGDAPLRVEFALGNAGLSLFAVDRVMAGAEGVKVVLAPERAVCKPATRAFGPLASVCCGPKPAASACCS
ncbi:MAG: DUF6428 family protein [Pseudomonadota bacterium]